MVTPLASLAVRRNSNGIAPIARKAALSPERWPRAIRSCTGCRTPPRAGNRSKPVTRWYQAECEVPALAAEGATVSATKGAIRCLRSSRVTKSRSAGEDQPQPVGIKPEPAEHGVHRPSLARPARPRSTAMRRRPLRIRTIADSGAEHNAATAEEHRIQQRVITARRRVRVPARNNRNMFDALPA